jgi:hypothetical protein
VIRDAGELVQAGRIVLRASRQAVDPLDDGRESEALRIVMEVVRCDSQHVKPVPQLE